MNLSAVVINWNSSNWLVRLLASLEDLADRLDSIIIIDNASTDFPDFIGQQFRNIQIHKMKRNLGFAAAANHGIGLTNSPFVLLLNPDIKIEGGVVEPLFEKIKQDPKIAIACGGLIGPDGTSQHAFQIRDFPTAINVISDALFLDEVLAIFRNDSKGAPVKVDRFEEDGIEIEQPAAAFWLLRKESWDSIGGFDERFYPAWWEDVDFCKRLSEKGWRIRFFPQFQLSHEGGVSLNTLPYSDFIRIFYGNLLLYWRKHHPLSFPLVWISVKLGVLLRLVFLRKR